MLAHPRPYGDGRENVAYPLVVLVPPVRTAIYDVCPCAGDPLDLRLQAIERQVILLYYSQDRVDRSGVQDPAVLYPHL